MLREGKVVKAEEDNSKAEDKAQQEAVSSIAGSVGAVKGVGYISVKMH